MTKRALRFVLAAALLWTGQNICLMPQSQCEDQARPPCHCHRGSQPKCCTGAHLEEAGVASGISFAAPASQPAFLYQPSPEPAPAAGWSVSPAFAVQAVPPHPPPRESSGRSPPVA
ncbi:MAG: hypothetical protein NTY77_04205 [Elusimicrobia bacterium]|nr:hypothetical protein [Elusimicrobiota bacterium]